MHFPYNRLPADVARRHFWSNFFGLHYFVLGEYGGGAVMALSGLGTTVLLPIILAMPNLGINSHCCYPRGLSSGYGSCHNSSAPIHGVPDHHPCNARSAVWYILLATIGAMILFNRGVFYSLEWLFERSTRTHPLEFHTRALLFSPDTWLFGMLCNIGFRRRIIREFHRLFGWLFLITGAFFATIAVPLDRAWRCYPDSLENPDGVSIGTCDDVGSDAYRKYVKGGDGGSITTHTPMFWWSGAIMTIAMLTCIAMTLFVYSGVHGRMMHFYHREIKKKP